MNATEELRNELARRGIECETTDDGVTRVMVDGRLVTYYEIGERFSVMTLSPDFSQGDDLSALTVEQAIETTFGGTCQRVRHPHRTRASGPQYTCSKCGYGASDFRWAYCPKCGRKYSEEIDEQR